MLLVVIVGVVLLLAMAASLTQRSHARHQAMRHHPTNGI
jgi:hypothetical protein